MKLIFTKLETSKDYLEVSFDNGKSWTTYKKSEILDNGITFTDEQCTDLEQIRFKGGIKKLENIDVKSSIGTAFSESYVVNSNGVFRFTGNIIIPNSATSIGTYAFYNCAELTSVTIPDSVTVIDFEAFRGCSKLTSVTIPDSVTSIGMGAFNGCKSLTTINYTGTEDQWNAITKGSGWNADIPDTCVINYNYQG